MSGVFSDFRRFPLDIFSEEFYNACLESGDNPEIKYRMVYIRTKKSRHESLIEFRYPDGVMDIGKTEVTALVNAAIVALAIKISYKGILVPKYEHINACKNMIDAIYYPDDSSRELKMVNFSSEFKTLARELKTNIISIIADFGFNAYDQLTTIENSPFRMVDALSKPERLTEVSLL